MHTDREHVRTYRQHREKERFAFAKICSPLIYLDIVLIFILRHL